MTTKNMTPAEFRDIAEYIDQGLPLRDDRDRLAAEIVYEMRKGGSASLIARHSPLKAFREAQAIAQARIAQGRAPRGPEADDDLRAAIKGLDLPAAVARRRARLDGRVGTAETLSADDEPEDDEPETMSPEDIAKHVKPAPEGGLGWSG